MSAATRTPATSRRADRRLTGASGRRPGIRCVVLRSDAEQDDAVDAVSLRRRGFLHGFVDRQVEDAGHDGTRRTPSPFRQTAQHEHVGRAASPHQRPHRRGSPQPPHPPGHRQGCGRRVRAGVIISKREAVKIREVTEWLLPEPQRHRDLEIKTWWSRSTELSCLSVSVPYSPCAASLCLAVRNVSRSHRPAGIVWLDG